MNFLFWNTNQNKNINSVLVEIVKENKCDFIILAEYQDDESSLLNALYADGLDFQEIFAGEGCPRIRMFTSVNVELELYGESAHYSIKRIRCNSFDYIIAGVHFQSKLYGGNEKSRDINANFFINDIISAEESCQHENTIIVGDFNANPFEDVMIDAFYMHSLPIRKEAMRKTRKVDGHVYKTFYNPMWNFFGDKCTPYGTYYCNNSKQRNMFDQVIIRPILIEKFNLQKLSILTETKKYNLLNAKGLPNKTSDHLPLFFCLDN